MWLHQPPTRKTHHSQQSSSLFLLLLMFLTTTSLAVAQDLQPVLTFHSSQLPQSEWTAVGGVEAGISGPRPPEFPSQSPDSMAARFDGSGSRFVYDDPGDASPIDFCSGDSIALEAWCQLDGINQGGNAYIIGKGRTHRPGFPQDNQNWALRLREVDGRACVNFLFASSNQSASGSSHWHRWTSDVGMDPSAQWHHVAVNYTFGEPDSLRCWLDGQAIVGSWDMGGATDNAPIVDNDQVWIGSSMGGNSSNSFYGAIAGVAVYRGLFTDAVIQEKFQRDPKYAPSQESSFAFEELTIPEGKVLFQAIEGHKSHASWYPSHRHPGNIVSEWNSDCFLLQRLPLRYDAWGIRDDWQLPVLVRAIADVELPAGKHSVLIRARGLARLIIDNKVIVSCPPHSGTSDGHQPVEPLPSPPIPGLRAVQWGNQERIATFEQPQSQRARVVFEFIAGTKSWRPEPGETLVALQAHSNSAAPAPYVLLTPNAQSRLPISDDVVLSQLASIEHQLQALDDKTRWTSAAAHDHAWQERHQFARQWLAQHPGPAVPEAEDFVSHDSTLPQHPIDRFLAKRIDAAIQQQQSENTASSALANQAVSLIRERCGRCHGENDQGGLQLLDRQLALAGGDSGAPAIVPGDVLNSEVLNRVASDDEDLRMPPAGPLEAAEVALLTKWIEEGAPWLPSSLPENLLKQSQAAAVDDASFVRRAYLDTVGVPPTSEEAQAYVDDSNPEKKAALLDRLLNDQRVADNWVSLWQDLLAENPNPLKPSLNNSGPFRWFLHEALRDQRPWDRVVTELIMLRGSERLGGSKGFGFAADNDVPLAEKAHVIAGTFLGIDLQCARCHDAPYSDRKQSDLFNLAAMLKRDSQPVPPSSSVDPGFFAANPRQSLISVTLNPGTAVEPVWPFEELVSEEQGLIIDGFLADPNDSRERLAAYVTAPVNERFTQVIVNHYWKRLIGTGIVEPVQDWDAAEPSHPELLEWLARDFVAHNYSLTQLMRTIMTSDLYARQAVGDNSGKTAVERFFAAPDRRRMTAEQVVDSMLAVAGMRLDVEAITFDPEARRPAGTMINLGAPQRAWEFATLANERDRPSLSLPRAQVVVDVLTAFGWDGSRQSPVYSRDQQANLLQPSLIANSTFTDWITRATVENHWSELALMADDPRGLAQTLYWQILGRTPTETEAAIVIELLSEGFASRCLPKDQIESIQALPPLPNVSWSNHLKGEANEIQLIRGQRAKLGAANDPRLEPQWREAYEDCIWALINSPEFVWIP